MDDFERKLAVALKTAADDLSVEPAGSVAQEIDHASAPARRDRSRVLLAAAVVVLLVAAVGGAWWTVSGPGAGDRSAPAGAAACTADDLRPTVFQLGDDGFDPDVRTVAALGYVVTAGCTLAEPPTLSSEGTQYRWDPTPRDTNDPAVWQPVDLRVGDVITFAAVQVHLAGADCVVGGRAQEVTFTLLGRTDTMGTKVSPCGPITLTTQGVTASSGPTTHAPEAPCSSSDLLVAPTDIGQGTTAVGLDVIAVNACTLEHPPTSSVDLNDVAYAASATDPGDDTPWVPTALRAGEHVRFALTFGDTSAASCPAATSDVTVRASVDSGARTVFRWTGSACGLNFLRLTPRSPVDGSAPAPCTDEDVDLRSAVTEQNVTFTFTFTANAGVSCRLVDPPTVMADGALVSWRPSVDPQVGGAWPAPVLEPGHDVNLVVQQTCVGFECPEQDSDANLAVSVAGAWVGKGVLWKYRGNAGLLVSTLR